MDPLLIDVPEVVETDRLILRAPRPGEGAAVNAAIAESLAALQPWMPWAATMPTVDQSEAQARRSAGRFRLREDLPYRMWMKDTGLFVGGTGLHRMDWSVPRFEIGYWCRTSLAGRGYVTEAVRALAAIAIDQLNARRIEIICDATNQPSRRVAERAGFTLEAVLRCNARDLAGNVCDECVYALIPPAP